MVLWPQGGNREGLPEEHGGQPTHSAAHGGGGLPEPAQESSAADIQGLAVHVARRNTQEREPSSVVPNW
jgi:hypothetical protein